MNTVIPATGKESVETDGDKIEAPENAIPNAASARVVYERMRDAHEKRARIFAKIQGMIDGNPPYSKELMKKHGLQTSSNVNWRDAESIVEGVALTYWSLFNDVQYMAEFTTNMADAPSNSVIGQVVSKEWDRVMREWPSFQKNMAENQLELIVFGSSFFLWPDEADWRYETADVWRFLVPERARNDAHLLNLCAIEETKTAQELWDIYDNYKGDLWNKEVVGEILVRCANYKSQINTDVGQIAEELQTRLRNGETDIEELYNDDITLVSVFVKELDGGVSRGIFHPNVQVSSSSDWAFFADRQYENMTQAICNFSFTPGQKYIHGNKGIGHRTYNTIEGITQVDNSLMDGIRRSSTVLVRSRPGRNKETKQIQFSLGGFTDVGEAELVQNLMGANHASGIEGSRYFRSKLEMNNNISGAFMSNPDGGRRTLGETQLAATKEARVQKNRVSHYYDQLDNLFRETVRKMLHSKPSDPGYEQVKIWKDRCIEQGVPEDFFVATKANSGPNGLPLHMEIRATRASGSGSQVADQIETKSMMSLLPTLGERGRQNVLKDYVAAHRGYRFIDRYLPPEDQQQQPVGDDTIASIENNQLEKGEMVIVSPDNNHAVHAPRHLERLNQISKIFTEAENAARDAGSEKPSVDAGQYGQYGLVEVDIAFQTLGPHFVRHLLFLQQDPTRAALAQSLGRQWAILANFGDKIANNAQEHRVAEMRKAQKQQQEMDDRMSELNMEERIAMRQLQVDERIKMAKLRGEIERGATKDQLQYIVQRQKVSFDNEIKRAKAISDIAMKQAKEDAQSDETDSEQVTGRKRTERF
jgi:hypothetical protein